MKHILFTGGGSAGHVVPNLAVMRELRYAFRLSYMGTGGIEKKLVQEAGYPFFQVNCPKLVRSLTSANLKIPFALHRAKRKALAVLERERPDLVFSKGGFASYPAVWAANRLKIPVFTHESDLSPGLCTRLIAKKCTYVLTSFPETAKRFANGKHVGSPIRRELFGGEKGRAMHKFGLPEQFPVLLVFGGGSGSKALNEAVCDALPELLAAFSVLHITGGQTAEKAVKTGDSSNTRGGKYLAMPYLGDMASGYAAADVVLCRAGSNTVFEVLALKKAAILVPLERGSRGDQVENARYFEQRGLVTVLPERELSRLAEIATQAHRDEIRKRNLAGANIQSGTGEIVKLIKEQVGAQSGGAKL